MALNVYGYELPAGLVAGIQDLIDTGNLSGAGLTPAQTDALAAVSGLVPSIASKAPLLVTDLRNGSVIDMGSTTLATTVGITPLVYQEADSAAKLKAAAITAAQNAYAIQLPKFPLKFSTSVPLLNESSILGPNTGGGFSHVITATGVEPAFDSWATSFQSRFTLGNVGINAGSLAKVPGNTDSNYVLMFKGSNITRLQNFFITGLGSAEYDQGKLSWNGLCIIGGDSQHFEGYRQFDCGGRQFTVGFGSQGITFAASHFESYPDASAMSHITPHYGHGGPQFKADGTTPNPFAATRLSGSYFQFNTRCVFTRSQLERAGTVLIDGGGNRFESIPANATNLVAGYRSYGTLFDRVTTEDSSVMGFGLGTEFVDVDAVNINIRGRITLGENSDFPHAASDLAILPAGVDRNGNLREWLVMARVYSGAINNVQAAPDGISQVSTAAGAQVLDASGTVLQTSPKHNLLAAGTSVGLNTRDEFTATFCASSTTPNIKLRGVATLGGAAADVKCWRNLIVNGSLLQSSTTAVPTGWSSNNMSFSAGTRMNGGRRSVALTCGAGGGRLEIGFPVEVGHTYMLRARVYGLMDICVGYADQGAAGYRQTFAQTNMIAGKAWNGSAETMVEACGTGYGDGSKDVMLLWIAGASTYFSGHVSIGSLGALNGAGNQEVEFVTVTDMTRPGRTWTLGVPTDSAPESAVQWEIDETSNAIMYVYRAGAWQTIEKTQTVGNLMTYSEQVDNAAWNKTNVTVTANNSTGPDGNTTADTVLETTAAAKHYLTSPFGASVSVGTTYTYSFYLKAVNGRNWIIGEIYSGVSGGHRVYVDLTNGAIGSNDAGFTSRMSFHGNGWYRIAVTWTADTTAIGFNIMTATSDGADPNFAGDITKGYAIWGGQCVVGTAAKEYVSRAA